jgi:asparagine synthase (glutamine-hydrolysing)
MNPFIFCARDRYGVKPFYYLEMPDYILFASEIKAILCDSAYHRTANDPLVYDYLVHGLVEHTRQTFFKDIDKLPAGHYMTVNEQANISITKYYDISFSNEIGKGISDHDIQTFAALFEDALRVRIDKHSPHGCCLSGGLDSSAIVCMLDNINKRKGIPSTLNTFSCCPDDKRMNEKAYIDAVIKKTKAANEAFDPSAAELVANLNDLFYAQDEPFVSGSVFAGYALMQRVKEAGLPILFDGQGADEILCGYRKSRIYYVKKLWQSRRYFQALSEFALSASQIATSLSLHRDIIKARRVLFGHRDNKPEVYINPTFHQKEDGFFYDLSQDFQFNDLMVISAPALLRYADRNASAQSLGLRFPFLDYRLVEFCAALPLSAKLKRGYSKAILRASLDLPDKVKWRKSKLGFGVPEDTWINAQSEYFKQLFMQPDRRTERYINRNQIASDWNQILSNMRVVPLWRYISLELWMRTFEVS